MFNFRSYAKAGSVQEAIRLLGENPDAHLIAGGTDILVKLHKGKAQFDHLVDIHDLAELNFITQNDSGDIIIGPLVRFTQVAESELIYQHIPILSQAVLTIGGPQVRNVATIGGHLARGRISDVIPLFLALDATITVYVNEWNIPTAQISILVFEDNFPINNAPDLPSEDPANPGNTDMSGFQIIVEDAGGR